MHIYFIGIYSNINNKIELINKIYNLKKINLFYRYSFYKLMNQTIKNILENNILAISKYFHNKKIMFRNFKFKNLIYCIVTNINNISKISFNDYENIKFIITSISNQYYNFNFTGNINLNKYIKVK